MEQSWDTKVLKLQVVHEEHKKGGWRNSPNLYSGHFIDSSKIPEPLDLKAYEARAEAQLQKAYQSHPDNIGKKNVKTIYKLKITKAKTKVDEKPEAKAKSKKAKAKVVTN